jgi:hypothetical protein
MDAESGKALAAFGFLTVLESPEHGLFGGYLVLSPQGRPLEFRCSTPVVASRAQEILYGPTLRPYLLTDVIGQSLVAGSELSVAVILTDERDMLPLSLVRREVVLHVERLPGNSPVDAVDGAERPVDESFEFEGCRICAPPASAIDSRWVTAMLEPLATSIHLAEPFERIRAALTEAQLTTHDAAEEPNDRAAAA